MKIWLSTVEGKATPLKTIDIIFGKKTSEGKSINFCILHAKWYIHLNKQVDNHKHFANFLLYLKNVLVIEKQIAVNQKLIKSFNETFQKVLKVTVKAKWIQKIIFNISMASYRNTDLLPV